MTSQIPSPRELVVVAHPEARLRVTAEGVTALKDGSLVEQLASTLTRESAILKPLYGVSEDFLEGQMASKQELFSEPALNLSLYYRVVAPDDRLESLIDELRRSELIDAAYIKPGAALAIFDTISARQPSSVSNLSSCNFIAEQMYLAPGEFGIDARPAWTLKGGDGEGMTIIDIEGAWCFSHTDLKENQGGLIGGVSIDDQLWRDHGTAVLGVLGGDVNDFGITGICPRACLRAVSIFGFPNPSVAPTWGTEAAIRLASDALRAGDIITLELHFPGPPRFEPHEERGHIAAEWWPDCMAAINYATSRDIIVVSAAGNGYSNLDDDIYRVNPDFPHGPFPSGWHNPFQRNPIDTGSILVGAGAPLSGFHGTACGPGRSRLEFSNYGTVVDAQAWGGEVTTCGYGELQCSTDEEFHYTTSFNGTSSATAIVAGVVACIQGIRKASNKAPLSSKQMRQLLHNTGSPQTDFPGPPARPASERIGNLPNLRQLIEQMP